jgi:PAS domain S-box-containing protein
MSSGSEPRFGTVPARTLIDAATLAMLLDHAYDAVAVRRGSGDILYWNKGAERTYGWSAAAAVGQFCHGLLRTQFPKPLAAIESTLAAHGVWEGQLVHTHKDGSQVTVDSRRVLDAAGGEHVVLETAESQGTDRGSTFRVRLPRVQQGLREAEPAPSTSVEAAVSKRVLIADDNRDAAESLQLWLQLAGHDVQIAGNGLEALRVAAEFKPDVALLDLGMPGLNGFDVARKIRDSAWGSDIVLVALTGWGQDEDRKQSAEAGFNHHLTKPVAPEAIESLVASL